MPQEPLLQLFRSELWKDQRRLEVGHCSGHLAITKFFDDPVLCDLEYEVLRYLTKHLSAAAVPVVLARGSELITLRYYPGIRVFNLIAELDRVVPPLDRFANEVKVKLVSRCEAHQKEIQAALFTWPARPRKPYPIDSKLTAIVAILSSATDVQVNWDAMSEEIDNLSRYWNSQVIVPFRDAATKNMLVERPDLALDEFASADERHERIVALLAHGYDFSEDRIIDYDFTSCSELTTLEDDVISLRYHERTWSGYPRNAGDVVWSGEPDPARASITFLVRYFRFGGRKAAYRLLNPKAHRVRFRHDNDLFYFERLPTIARRLWPDADKSCANLLAFSEAVAVALGSGRSDVDSFACVWPEESRTFYVDVYPH
jgi:hypothetical protein